MNGTLKPRADVVLLRAVEKEAKTGLIERFHRDPVERGYGDVVAVGVNVESVKPGQRVVYTGGGVPLTFNDESLIAVRDEDILAEILP